MENPRPMDGGEGLRERGPKILVFSKSKHLHFPSPRPSPRGEGDPFGSVWLQAMGVLVIGEPINQATAKNKASAAADGSLSSGRGGSEISNIFGYDYDYDYEQGRKSFAEAHAVSVFR